ncbi:MAG: hypothetical protein ACOYY2_03885 [Actinomycetota bacterium]
MPTVQPSWLSPTLTYTASPRRPTPGPAAGAGPLWGAQVEVRSAWQVAYGQDVIPLGWFDHDARYALVLHADAGVAGLARQMTPAAEWEPFGWLSRNPRLASRFGTSLGHIFGRTRIGPLLVVAGDRQVALARAEPLSSLDQVPWTMVPVTPFEEEDPF